MSAPRYWREIKYRYRLMGELCTECGAIIFPRRHLCPRCGCMELEECKLRETGTVLSWTIIHHPPRGYEKYAPYIVALIRLDDGAQILSQVVDVEPGEMRAGLRVEATFRRVREDGSSGIIEYGYKFRPIIEES